VEDDMPVITTTDGPRTTIRVVEDDAVAAKVAGADDLVKASANVRCIACNGKGVVPRSKRTGTSPNTDPDVDENQGAGETAIPTPDNGLPDVETISARKYGERPGFSKALRAALARPIGGR
jgi:hypothetical protein